MSAISELVLRVARASDPRLKARIASCASGRRSGIKSACRAIFLGSAFLCFSGASVGVAAGTNKANPLIGTWLLVKYVDTPEHGEPVFAFGKEPLGHFIFTAGGHVAFSMMRNPPHIDETTSDPDPDACVPGWYCAYFGTYEVDARRGVWVTHVKGGNVPAYLNTDQPRHFRISRDTLVVSETYLSGSTRVNAERVFVRESVPGQRRH